MRRDIKYYCLCCGAEIEYDEEDFPYCPVQKEEEDN